MHINACINLLRGRVVAFVRSFISSFGCFHASSGSFCGYIAWWSKRDERKRILYIQHTYAYLLAIDWRECQGQKNGLLLWWIHTINMFNWRRAPSSSNERKICFALNCVTDIVVCQFESIKGKEVGGRWYSICEDFNTRSKENLDNNCIDDICYWFKRKSLNQWINYEVMADGFHCE